MGRVIQSQKVCGRPELSVTHVTGMDHSDVASPKGLAPFSVSGSVVKPAAQKNSAELTNLLATPRDLGAALWRGRGKIVTSSRPKPRWCLWIKVGRNELLV